MDLVLSVDVCIVVFLFQVICISFFPLVLALLPAQEPGGPILAAARAVLAAAARARRIEKIPEDAFAS